MACILIEDADKLELEDIAEIVRTKAEKIKKEKDEEHKNKISVFKNFHSRYWV